MEDKNKPVPKVVAVGLAGSLATAVVTIVKAFGITLDPTLTSATLTLVLFSAGYFAPRETQQFHNTYTELVDNLKQEDRHNG